MHLGRPLRVLAIVSAGLLALGLVPGSASAKPPGNDDISHAQVITGVPSRITTDTREATRHNTDPDCVDEKSVWYRFDPTTEIRARAVTLGSDFGTLLAVFSGTPEALEPVACDYPSLVGSAVEVTFQTGTTYYIAVSECCGEGEEFGGGRAVLRLYVPATFTAKATLTSVKAGDASGSVRLRGRYRCSNPGVVSVSVTVRQRVGNNVAHGSRDFQHVCSAKSRVWTIRVDSETDVAFRPRRALVIFDHQATDGFTVIEGSSTKTRRLGLSPDGGAKPAAVRRGS